MQYNSMQTQMMHADIDIATGRDRINHNEREGPNPDARGLNLYLSWPTRLLDDGNSISKIPYILYKKKKKKKKKKK